MCVCVYIYFYSFSFIIRIIVMIHCLPLLLITTIDDIIINVTINNYHEPAAPPKRIGIRTSNKLML